MITTKTGESKESRALAAFAQVTRDGVQAPTPSDLDRGLDALFARITTGRAHRRGMVRWSLVGVTATLCILVGLKIASVSLKRTPSPDLPALAYEIEGGSVLEGGYLRESSHTGIKLSFNEGSKVVLKSGTRGRLRAVSRQGAEVAIEHGTASFQVTHSTVRRWLVEVGPFLVTVKGTIFSVSWDPSSERFELRLQRGRVVVSGPISGGDIALRAGQRLVVNLPKLETLISEETGDQGLEASPTPPPAVAPETRPPAAKEKAAAPKLSAAPAASKSENERGWTDALASGHWDRILRDVERAGVDATLDRASSEDLFALAHAARYRRQPDLARAALLAERRRFPNSPRSQDATFLLGRVEESRSNGTVRAIEWYDEYLAHAPSGAYAAEALGRKMTLASELGGPAKARPIAEEYLRRFPKGSYAGAARALRRVP